MDLPVFSARGLRLTWLDDGLMLPVVIPVDDVPAVPDRLPANVLEVSEVVLETTATGLARTAMALWRPSRVTAIEDDEASAEGLRAAFADRRRRGSCVGPPGAPSCH